MRKNCGLAGDSLWVSLDKLKTYTHQVTQVLILHTPKPYFAQFLNRFSLDFSSASVPLSPLSSGEFSALSTPFTITTTIYI